MRATEHRIARGVMPATAILCLMVLLASCSDNLRVSRMTQAISATARRQASTPSGSGSQDLEIARRFDGQQALTTVTTLANPSFMGRHVGTPGEAKGAQFVANAFAEAGLEPGGVDHSFLQPFPMPVEELATTPVLELKEPNGTTQQLHFRDDFRPVLGNGGDIRAAAFYAGDGTNLTGLTLSGKILVVTDSSQFLSVVHSAQAAGARAVIVITGAPVLLKSELRPPIAGALPVVSVSLSGASKLFDGSGHSSNQVTIALRGEPAVPNFPLAGQVHLSISLRPVAMVEGHNVIGVLRGTAGAGRTVIIGAHYEEIGPDPDGVVFPAADDNASGVSVLIEIARVLHESSVRPAATIIFAAWSGHEEGLYGSRYYVKHPLMPLSTASLYLNLDTVGEGPGAYLLALTFGSQVPSLVSRGLSAFQAAGAGLLVQSRASSSGTGDDMTFVGAHVPVLSFVWPVGGVIHTPMDTAAGVDPLKLQVTGQLSTFVVLEAAR